MDFFQFTPWAEEIIQTFGYLGLFFVNLLTTSTILLPLPGYILVFAFGGILNPWLVAFFSALGAALGELVSYGVGRGGRYILKEKHEKYFIRGKKWFEKQRGFLIIIIFAATPLPFDVVGILSGVLRYNIKRFVLATFIGKLIASLALAFAGFYGIDWVLSVFKPGL